MPLLLTIIMRLRQCSMAGSSSDYKVAMWLQPRRSTDSGANFTKRKSGLRLVGIIACFRAHYSSLHMVLVSLHCSCCLLVCDYVTFAGTCVSLGSRACEQSRQRTNNNLSFGINEEILSITKKHGVLSRQIDLVLMEICMRTNRCRGCKIWKLYRDAY